MDKMISKENKMNRGNGGIDLSADTSSAAETSGLSGTYKGLRVDKEIGRGRFSRVYSAHLPDIDSIRFALKVYYDRTDLCMKEAEALEKLADNKNVVQLKDVGTYDGKPCLLLEQADYSVRKVLNEQTATGNARTEWALSIFDQMLDAVVTAHDNGIVHGDIKPDNALLLDGIVKMTDFNLSKSDGVQSLEDRMTFSRNSGSAQSMAGTLCYSAPEGTRSPRADVYSLGVVLYELLTGKLPVGRYIPASKLSGAPKWVDTVIDKALSGDLSERYANANEFREVVNSLSGKTIPSRLERILDIDVGNLCLKSITGLGQALWTATKYTVFLPYTLVWKLNDGTSDQESATVMLGSILSAVCLTPFVIGTNIFRDAKMLQELRDNPPRGRIVWYDSKTQCIKSVAAKDLGKEELPMSAVSHSMEGAVDMVKGENGNVYVLRKYGEGGEIQRVDPNTGSIQSVLKLAMLKDASRIAVFHNTTENSINALVGNQWYLIKENNHIELLSVFTDPGKAVPESPDGKYMVESGVAEMQNTVQVVKPNDYFSDREIAQSGKWAIWVDSE